MKNLVFKNDMHKEKFEIVWRDIDEKNRTEKIVQSFILLHGGIPYGREHCLCFLIWKRWRFHIFTIGPTGRHE